MYPPALRGDFNFHSPKGEGNCELAGPERDESPGGAFEATFPTAGRDAGATPPPAALCHFLSAEKVKPGLPVRPE